MILDLTFDLIAVDESGITAISGQDIEETKEHIQEPRDDEGSVVVEEERQGKLTPWPGVYISSALI